jgi:hypothetical protein
MVVGLLAWLAWDIETDIGVASQRNGLVGLENEQWHAVQFLAALGPWLVDDESASTILEESVARTPRFRVDGQRWIAVHRAALETFALVALAPDEHGKSGRHVKPGDLVVLPARKEPRVCVVLNVGTRSNGVVIDILDHREGGFVRSFLSSRVATLAWDVDTSAEPVAS